eukprot:COSAG02_NODE_268_length_26526_cov_28.495554_16_plen_130_part_00
MSTEIGDQAWDDEELARAMALSLQGASEPPTEDGPDGLEQLLHLLPRADGFSPLPTSPSPRPSPGGLEQAARGSGRAGALAPVPADAPIEPRPYVAANPISGGTDTHNRLVVVSLGVPQSCEADFSCDC